MGRSRFKTWVKLCATIIAVGTCTNLSSAAKVASANVITPEEFVQEHNAYRCEVGLEPLAWDCELAAVAQLYSDDQASSSQCTMAHSTNAWRQAAFATVGYPNNTAATGITGENLAWLSGIQSSDGSRSPQIKNGREVSGIWASEKQWYNLGPSNDACTVNTQNKAVGHYTQQVWHSTRKIGCGVSQCSDGAVLFVCQYYPHTGRAVFNSFGRFSAPTSQTLLRIGF